MGRVGRAGLSFPVSDTWTQTAAFVQTYTIFRLSYSWTVFKNNPYVSSCSDALNIVMNPSPHCLALSHLACELPSVQRIHAVYKTHVTHLGEASMISLCQHHSLGLRHAYHKDRIVTGPETSVPLTPCCNTILTLEPRTQAPTPAKMGAKTSSIRNLAHSFRIQESP